MKYFAALFAIFMFFSCAEQEEEQAVPEDTALEETPQEETFETEPALEIPEAVQAAFKEKFPGAVVIGWEAEDDGYEAEYEEGGKTYEAEFDKSGKWLATEYEISYEELPEAVRAKIESDYADLERLEIENVILDELGQAYEVEFKKDGQALEVYFNDAGEVVRENTEPLEEESEEKED